MEHKGLSREERFYVFEKLPDNIRQIGEPPGENRIYLEDYVVTYMNRIFREKAGSALIVYVGKRGAGAAQGNIFLYGAIEIELDILQWKEQFTAQVWDEIHRQVHRYFSGGEVLGWGCGVPMANSQVRKAVLGIQRKHFSREGQVFFCRDNGEGEESVCRWRNSDVQPVPGYLIYYGKNPQMQDYMLRGEKQESFESDYQDSVMENVRAVIKSKEHISRSRRPALYAAGGMLLALTLLGAWLLMQSNQKIASLESAITTLSQMPAEGQGTEGGEEKSAPDATEASTPAPAFTAAPTPTGTFKTFEEKSMGGASQEEGGQAASTPTPTPAPTASAVPAAGGGGQKAQQSAAPAKDGSRREKKTGSETASGQEEKSGKAVSSAGASGRTGAKSYVVQPGDTLSQILWRQYHTVAYLEDVKRVNHIKNEDEIQAGQRLILPLYKK